MIGDNHNEDSKWNQKKSCCITNMNVKTVNLEFSKLTVFNFKNKVNDKCF